jgi:hypothetical protein
MERSRRDRLYDERSYRAISHHSQAPALNWREKPERPGATGACARG